VLRFNPRARTGRDRGRLVLRFNPRARTGRDLCSEWGKLARILPAIRVALCVLPFNGSRRRPLVSRDCG